MSYPMRRATRRPRPSGWWDPFAEIEAMHRRLDQLFFGTPPGPWGEPAGDLDLDETEDGWAVEAQLPGVPAGEVDVDLTDRELSIRGSAGPPEEGGEGTSKGRGRRRYSYRLTLPGEVDADRATATLENGLLTVTLPRSPRAAGRKIRVDTGTGATQPPTSMQEETAPPAGSAWGERPGSPVPEYPPPAGPAETTGPIGPPVTAGEAGMATYQQPGGAPYQPAETQGGYPASGPEQPLPDQPPPNYGYESYPAPAGQAAQDQQHQEPYQGWPEPDREPQDRRERPT